MCSRPARAMDCASVLDDGCVNCDRVPYPCSRRKRNDSHVVGLSRRFQELIQRSRRRARERQGLAAAKPARRSSQHELPTVLRRQTSVSVCRADPAQNRGKAI